MCRITSCSWLRRGLQEQRNKISTVAIGQEMSYKQMMFKAYQKHFTGNLVKKGEQIEI